MEKSGEADVSREKSVSQTVIPGVEELKEKERILKKQVGDEDSLVRQMHDERNR